MRNPRLYFTIELGIFYPYRGQNSVLDVKFCGNTKLIEENNYNKKINFKRVEHKRASKVSGRALLGVVFSATL